MLCLNQTGVFNMPTKYEVGDIVQLKSGGPQMTVKKITDKFMDDEPINCQWFSGSKLQDGWFNAESLVKIEDEEKE